MTKTSRRAFSNVSVAQLVAVAAVGLGPLAADAQVLADKGAVMAPGDSPLALTASDGAGLVLESLDAQVAVEDPLAFTELHLAFRNPENRVREGRFRITLPAGAVISRFALRIGDAWQEGEVVERQAARQAYEDFLHRRQDPALLETEAGNEFSARVFPIPAQGIKEIIVSYSQELPRTGEPYRLPLRGLPQVGSLTVHALVGRAEVSGGSTPASSLDGRRARHEVIDVRKAHFTPDRDFEIADRGAGRHGGVRNGNLVAVRVQPLGAADKSTPIDSLLVAVDTSASRALGFEQQLQRTTALLTELGRAGDPRVTVAAFDQDSETVFAGRASDFARSGAVARLQARAALGASDFQRLLHGLPDTLKKTPHHRVLLITDAVPTAGATAGDKLRGLVKGLGAVGVQRVDVLGVGGIRDDELAQRLVRAELPQDGLVLDAMAPVATLVQRLTRATRSGLKVQVDGSTWVWPERLDGVQAGDEVLIYADVPERQRVSVSIDGQPIALAGGLEFVARPLLERAWVKARMSRLLQQRDSVAATDADLAEALQRQVQELSIRHRVLCPLTALLVLETEADYARFRIERRALADILTLGPGGVTVLGRKDLAFASGGSLDEDEAIETTAQSPVERRRPVARLAKKPMRGTLDNLLEGLDGGHARRGHAEPQGAGGHPTPTAASAAPPPSMPAPSVAMAPRRAPVESAKSSASEAESRSSRRVRGELEDQVSHARRAPAASVASNSMADLDDRLTSGPPAREARRRAETVAEVEPGAPPMTGDLGAVMDLLAHHKRAEALAQAVAWRNRDAGDVLALVALGESLEAAGQNARAARAYGSIIDLFPSRADLRRFAGGRLERLGAAGLTLAIDTFRKAVADRPDHPAGARMLAFALVKAGRPAEAFDVLVAAVQRAYPDGRFRGVEQILREDLALVAATWQHADAGNAAKIAERLGKLGVSPEDAPSLRFVLTWETDANDVDFHVWDSQGGHAFYEHPALASGGHLYADVTTGYGPECFTIRGPAANRAAPYRLSAHYYSRGPMGYGMGKLQIIDHDGHGGLHFEERPFVIMQDRAFVNLGTYAGVPPHRTSAGAATVSGM